jgi:hypothetical protein
MTTHPNDLPEAVKALADYSDTDLVQLFAEKYACYGMYGTIVLADRVKEVRAELYRRLERPSTPSADAVGKAAEEVLAWAGRSEFGGTFTPYPESVKEAAAILTRHLGSGQTFGHVAEGGVAPGANGSPGDAGSTPVVSTPPANQEWASATEADPDNAIVASCGLQIATMRDGALWNDLLEIRMIIAQAIDRSRSGPASLPEEVREALARSRRRFEMLGHRLGLDIEINGVNVRAAINDIDSALNHLEGKR